MIFKFPVIPEKIEMDLRFEELSTANKQTQTQRIITTMAALMTLREVQMKNNDPSRFLKQDDIEYICWTASLYMDEDNLRLFEESIRKKYEKKCEMCGLERNLENGECDCRIVECGSCGYEQPKYLMTSIEGCWGLRCDNCIPTEEDEEEDEEGEE